MIRPTRPLLIIAGVLGLAAFSLAAPAPVTATPVAPRPTSTAHSPEAPDPHPQRGGIGPNGQAVGGPRLLGRGLILPGGAPKLPTGLTATAWMLSDLDTGEILAARDPHGRYQPASILKALTSLVLLPKLSGRTVVTASADAANAEGSAVGLVAGGKYTVDTLFRSLLLMSGNDAATALSDAGGGVATTVAAMNAEARRLGAYDTVVQTPSGLDGWQQLTSAYDLSLVLRAAVDTPRFVAYDRSPTAQLPPQKVGAQSWGSVPLYNQSEDFFTSVPGALIAKTGFTDAAQHTYMCAAQRGGRRLGVVFLRAQRVPTDQWQQAAALLAWGYKLPSHTLSVGELAGPALATAPTSVPTTVASGSASATPSASPSPSPGAVAAGTAGHRGIGAWPIINGALIAILVGAVGLRARRSVVRRRAGSR